MPKNDVSRPCKLLSLIGAWYTGMLIKSLSYNPYYGKKGYSLESLKWEPYKGSQSFFSYKLVLTFIDEIFGSFESWLNFEICDLFILNSCVKITGSIGYKGY